MFNKSVLNSLFSFSAAFIISCGGGGGGENEISGVWEGTYQSISGAKAPVCLEINQSGGSLSGKGWVSGSLWNENITGSISDDSININLSGNDLFDNPVNVNINGSVVINRITGNLEKNAISYSLSLTKSTKSSCDWASRELTVSFAQALSRAITGDPDDPAGKILASFVTMVPLTDVKLNGTTYNNWWVCIWEVRDKVANQEYTVASIIDNISFQREAIWYVNDDNLLDSIFYIGLDSSLNSVSVDISNLSDTGNRIAGFIDIATPSNSFYADGGIEDKYHNTGTSLSGTPFFVSPCSSGEQYKVWMTTIPFYIYFDNGTKSFAVPPNAPSSTKTVPALYIERDSC